MHIEVLFFLLFPFFSASCFSTSPSPSSSSSSSSSTSSSFLQATTQDDLLPVLMSCDVIVYNIADSNGQVEEASWAVQSRTRVFHTPLQLMILAFFRSSIFSPLSLSLSLLPPSLPALHDQLSSFASQKVFICISTIMTWARTKPLNIVRNKNSL